jgi:hypothetical protein
MVATELTAMAEALDEIEIENEGAAASGRSE